MDAWTQQFVVGPSPPVLLSNLHHKRSQPPAGPFSLLSFCLLLTSSLHSSVLPPPTHRLIHQQKFEAKNHDETHDAVGDYVKSMIFGGLDGILTSFAIVAGAAGGGLPVQVVMVLGFSNIFADAFSMGMGEYLSSKAHNEFVMKEKERETW